MLVVRKDRSKEQLVEFDDEYYDKINDVSRKGDDEILAYVRYYLEKGGEGVLTLDGKLKIEGKTLFVERNGRSLGIVAYYKYRDPPRDVEGYDEDGRPIELYYDALTNKHLIAISFDLPTFAKTVRLIIASSIVIEVDLEERIAAVYYLF